MRLVLIALILTSCTIRFKARVDTTTADTQRFSWSVDATAKGTIAHMHVQVIEERKRITVAGYLMPTAKGEEYLDPQPVRFYRVSKTYMTKDNKYNGVTLPLRLKWMTQQRSKDIREIQTWVQMVIAHEKELSQLANNCYHNFSRLHIANDKAYTFNNLDSQVEIKFSGKKFFDLKKVANVIRQKEKELRQKEVSHKKRRCAQLEDDGLFARVAATYKGVIALGGEDSGLGKLKLPFDSKAKDDADFMQLAEKFARLKQARLRLARLLLELYEPRKLTFHYAIGVKQDLRVRVFADDRRHNEGTFRYEMRTTTAKHKKEFALGHVYFDSDLNLKGMWISLKPRGGVPGFAKLTFKPCLLASSSCPQADFN